MSLIRIGPQLEGREDSDDDDADDGDNAIKESSTIVCEQPTCKCVENCAQHFDATNILLIASP